MSSLTINDSYIIDIGLATPVKYMYDARHGHVDL